MFVFAYFTENGVDVKVKCAVRLAVITHFVTQISI